MHNDVNEEAVARGLDVAGVNIYHWNAPDTYNGVDQITTTEVTTAFTDEMVKDNAEEYGGTSTMLNLLQNIVPLAGLILGLLLLLGGLLIVLASRRGEQDADDEHREAVPAGAHRVS